MNTQLNHPTKTDNSLRKPRYGKLLTTLDMLGLSAIVVSVGLFGIELARDADEDSRNPSVAVAAPATARITPRLLKLDNGPVSKIGDSTPSPLEVNRAPAESIWDLDEPKVITADVADSFDRGRVVPVSALQPLTAIRQRAPKEMNATPPSEVVPSGKSHVWKPSLASSAGTSSPSGKARVTRASIAAASATGHARVSLLPPVERRQPNSGRATVSSPFPISSSQSSTGSQSTTGRARVVLAATDNLSAIGNPAKNAEKKIEEFTLDLDRAAEETVSIPRPKSPIAPKVTKHEVAKRAAVKKVDRPTPTETSVASLDNTKTRSQIQPLPQEQALPWELSESKTATTAKTAMPAKTATPARKIVKNSGGERVVEVIAQAEQPEPQSAPKKDVPPSPVPETTVTPETLGYTGFKPIGEVTVDISVKGDPPPDLAKPEFEAEGKLELDTEWIDQTLTAPTYALYHQPLYFEDPNAERCGETWGFLQPAVSAAQFYLTIPALPYLIGALPPNESVESLGDCAWGCKYRYRDAYLPPLSLKGAALQGAAVTGLIFLIP